MKKMAKMLKQFIIIFKTSLNEKKNRTKIHLVTKQNTSAVVYMRGRMYDILNMK